jgi:hypothetical protein
MSERFKIPPRFFDFFPACDKMDLNEAKMAHPHWFRLGLGLFFVVWLAITGPSPAFAFDTTSVWQGEYYSNQDLSGDPALTRDDPAIDFDWGTGSPDPAIPADHFSVRWTRTVYLDAATWRVTVTADDGVRLWVDGILVIDRWYDQSATMYSNDLALPAGEHTVRMEYYDDYMNAMARLSYVRLGGIPSGAWLGQYFDNDSLDGTPVFTRFDPAINFDWGTDSPAVGLPSDRFSVKWDSTQTLARSGNYSIIAAADDGIRVWIDGALVIDAWYDQPATPRSATRWLNLGAHTMHVEYYERTVNASVSVQIVATAAPISSGGDVIVDDGTPGWQAGGATLNWREAWSGFGSHSLWTLNHASTVSSYLWARWYPTLPHAGNYQVCAYIPSDIATTLNAHYWIYHDGRYDSAVRAQGFYANQWVSLGTYYFAARGGEFVSLSDVTSECSQCRAIVFDAVKFSPR